MIKSNKGFSLVELMVVVAIIGILSAIAIPNFQRFQRKSRQSEAKTLLGGIYAMEKAFHTEWNQFIADLDTGGYIPSGQLRYRAGFGAAGIAAPTGYTGPAYSTRYDTTALCTAFATQCTQVSSGATALTGAVVPAGIGLASLFTAVAASVDTAVVAVAATADIWTMNHLGLLSNSQSGI